MGLFDGLLGMQHKITMKQLKKITGCLIPNEKVDILL